jgi:hypothetical protein
MAAAALSPARSSTPDDYDAELRAASADARALVDGLAGGRGAPARSRPVVGGRLPRPPRGHHARLPARARRGDREGARRRPHERRALPARPREPLDRAGDGCAAAPHLPRSPGDRPPAAVTLDGTLAEFEASQAEPARARGGGAGAGPRRGPAALPAGAPPLARAWHRLRAAGPPTSDGILWQGWRARSRCGSGRPIRGARDRGRRTPKWHEPSSRARGMSHLSPSAARHRWSRRSRARDDCGRSSRRDRALAASRRGRDARAPFRRHLV